MVISHTSDNSFSLKNLSVTSGTSVALAFLSHNGFDIHPTFVTGLLLMPKIDGITIFAVNFSIESIVKRGGV